MCIYIWEHVFIDFYRYLICKDYKARKDDQINFPVNLWADCKRSEMNTEIPLNFGARVSGTEILHLSTPLEMVTSLQENLFKISWWSGGETSKRSTSNLGECHGCALHGIDRLIDQYMCMHWYIHTSVILRKVGNWPPPLCEEIPPIHHFPHFLTWSKQIGTYHTSCLVCWSIWCSELWTPLVYTLVYLNYIHS